MLTLQALWKVGKALMKRLTKFHRKDNGRRQAKQREKERQGKPQKPAIGPHRQQQGDAVGKNAGGAGSTLVH